MRDTTNHGAAVPTPPAPGGGGMRKDCVYPTCTGPEDGYRCQHCPCATPTPAPEGETATERTTMEQPTENQQEVRHAGRMGDDRRPLCGATTGRATRPKESINCPECRIIVNFVRETYPHHAGHTDWRLTPEQERKAIARMAADMYGGDDD
jgi:hypothetical protein